METTTNRKATTPSWGGLRDGMIAMATTAVGAWVLTQTGSPELSQAANEFSGGFANLVLGAAVGAGSFGRKALAEWLASRV